MTDKIKLIACDIDNTLPLCNGKISVLALNTIKSIMEKDVVFCLASGRHYADMFNISDKLGCIYICCDGALTVKNGRALSERIITKEILKEIFKRTKASVLLYSFSKVYCFSENAEFVSKNQCRYEEFEAVKSEQEIKENIYKIAFFGTDDFDPAIRYVTANKKLVRVYNNQGWKEFVEFGTNKGTALKTILQEHSIKEENAAAFGDNINDMEMLKLVRHSFAAENAKNQVRRLTKYKTDDIIKTLKGITEVGK